MASRCQREREQRGEDDQCGSPWRTHRSRRPARGPPRRHRDHEAARTGRRRRCRRGRLRPSRLDSTPRGPPAISRPFCISASEASWGAASPGGHREHVRRAAARPSPSRDRLTVADRGLVDACVASQASRSSDRPLVDPRVARLSDLLERAGRSSPPRAGAVVRSRGSLACAQVGAHRAERRGRDARRR